MSVKQLQSVVARTATSTGVRGTAFLISNTHALTCAHCLGETAQTAVHQVDLHFSDWSSGQDVTATVVQQDWALDVVLVPLSYAVDEGADWWSFAYPYPVENDGFTLTGQVVNPQARSYSRHAMQLNCDQAKDKVNGASGGLVMVDGNIVAMLNEQLLEYTDTADTTPVFGALYGVPLSQLATVYWLSPFFSPIERDKTVTPVLGEAASLTITLRRSKDHLIRTFSNGFGCFDQLSSP